MLIPLNDLIPQLREHLCDALLNCCVVIIEECMINFDCISAWVLIVADRRGVPSTGILKWHLKDGPCAS